MSEITEIDSSFMVTSNSTFDPDSPLSQEPNSTINESYSTLSKKAVINEIKTNPEEVTYVQLAKYELFSRVKVAGLQTEYVRCSKCENLLKYLPNSNNSGLVRHTCSRQTDTSQLSINNFVIKKPNSLLKSTCVQRVVKYVTNTSKPFRIVDETAFIDLAQYFINLGAQQGSVNAKELIPHSTTVSRNIDDLYTKEVDILIERFKSINNFCIIVDHWDSKYTHSKFIGIAIRYIFGNERKSSLLWFKQVSDGKSQTSAEIINKCLNRFKLESRDFRAVSDNAANMIALFRILNCDRIPCVAHKFNTCLKDSFANLDKERDKNLIKLLANVKSLVEYVNRTKKINCVLSNDIDTRFDTKYLMINAVVGKWSIIQSEAELAAETGDKKLELLIEKIDLSLLKKLHVFLKFVYEVRCALCVENKSTINLVLPAYQKVLKILEKDIDSEDEDARIVALKKLYLDSFRQKFVLLDDHKHATFLSPKFRELHNLLDDNQKQKVYDYFNDYLNKFSSDDPIESDNDDQAGDDFFGDFTCPPNKRMRRLNELDLYKEFSFVTSDLNDPLEFWIKHQKTFPLLSKLALSLLIVPASSCIIERVFSQCSILLSNRRNLILPEKANKCMFLKVNS